jgi:hypothetical protein
VVMMSDVGAKRTVIAITNYQPTSSLLGRLKGRGVRMRT